MGSKICEGFLKALPQVLKNREEGEEMWPKTNLAIKDCGWKSFTDQGAGLRECAWSARAVPNSALCLPRDCAWIPDTQIR